MEIVRILFIDDDDLDSYITLLQTKLANLGFQLEASVLYVSHPDFHFRNHNGETEIDGNKLKNKIEELYFDTPFDEQQTVVSAVSANRRMMRWEQFQRFNWNESEM